VPLITVHEPDSFGCLARTRLQEHLEQVFRPVCERAGKTLEPSSWYDGGKIRRVGAGPVIIDVTADFHFQSPAALELWGGRSLQEHVHEMGLGQATSKRIELQFSNSKIHVKWLINKPGFASGARCVSRRTCDQPKAALG
jgi:hypothetical protein